MREAAGLLMMARTMEGIADLVRAAGLASTFAPVDHRMRDSLGLETERPLQVAGGIGSVRVLVMEIGSPALRDELERVARRLSSRAPHVLWLIAALHVGRGRTTLVAVRTETRRLRLASLAWEPDQVVDSDAETLCALSALAPDADLLFHGRVFDVLGRDALTRRFYRALQSQVSALASDLPRHIPAEDASDLALLYVSRLLFLHFLEAKGWLDGDRAFVARRFDDCMRAGGAFHGRVLLPLFFGTLNTPRHRRAATARAFGRIPFLNGGLFSRAPQERKVGASRFSDERLGVLLQELFQRFRFVAREDSATWSEASVDPEMLGRAFESLMASGARRVGGVYYTPHELVARVADHALAVALPTPTLRQVRDVRVLDPACGSGAFLVYVLERLSAMRIELGERNQTSTVRRDVLARSIFGVDRSPTAVWMCELRLWLSVVIENDESDPAHVPPLPNLDRNVRVGDALTGSAFEKVRQVVVGGARMAELRQRYVRATGARKQSLARMLDREERRRLVAQLDRELEAAVYARKERLSAERTRDLFGQRQAPSGDSRRELRRLRDRTRALRVERRRVAEGGALPFSFGACFAEAQAASGFDVVLGNPPWVRVHRIPDALRQRFKHDYEVYRAAPWQSGALGARAALGFASQVDLAALFVERSLDLLRDDGVVSLLVPTKLWRSLAGGGVRQMLTRRAGIVRLEDLSQSKHAFDAAVYPSLVVARLGPTSLPLTVAVHAGTEQREWTTRREALAFDATSGAPWLMLTPEVRAAFDRVRDAGTPLSGTEIGPPRLGVKSGCNVAFLVRATDTSGDLAAVVDADGERGVIEARLLRPALRGDAVLPWHRPPCTEWILWTHDEQGAPLARLPDASRAWLRRRYGLLAARTDAARGRRWWGLFRVDAAESGFARVVWADFGKRPRALVLPPGDPCVPLNTCYVIRCRDDCDATALATLLNSKLASAWLNAIAEPARGGYRRYLGWTVGLLPIPRDWPRARTILSASFAADDDLVLAATLEAYGLTHALVRPLLDWNS